jgi:hypothetical protein
MNCKECKQTKPIVNKHFGLCLECNNIRLHGSKHGKQHKFTNTKRTPLRSRKNKSNSLFSNLEPKKKASTTRLELDEQFYLRCFEKSNHRCEECGKRLPTEFRDSEGNVNARWRYSHIVAKSIAPELRRNEDNINHLCQEHHTQWDHGDRKVMKIYEKNAAKFPRYF